MQGRIGLKTIGQTIAWALGGVLLLALIALALAAPVMSWPMTDEANYLLQTRQIAQGLLPYRDFYDFITPGGQWLGALYAMLSGEFSVVGIRLLIVLGWIVQIGLIWEMAREHMPRSWLVLLAAFLWLTDSRYPVHQHHFWSGMTALLAVYFAWKHLQRLYAGQKSGPFLLLSGMMTAATFWITQSLGVLMAGALAVFGLLHCFLHEHEEKNLTFGAVDNRLVLRRWLGQWGCTWGLGMLGVHLLCVGALMALGLWPAFWRDAILWLAGGHYAKTTVLGYYSTFHSEFMDTIRPLAEGVRMPWLLLFLFRIPIALHVFLIGFLPAIGLVGSGLILPQRFLYRLLRRDSEALLLFFIATLALIASTFSYSTSMHITSNGALGFLLGAWVLHGWVEKRPRLQRIFPALCGVFFALLLLGAAVGSGMLGTWLPRFHGLNESLLYTDARIPPRHVVAVANLFSEAEARKRSVFVLGQSPALYLTTGARNATRFTLIIPQYTTDFQMREILSDLQRHRPMYVVDDQSVRFLGHDVRFRGFSPQDLRMPEMERYLERYYERIDTLGRLQIYRRHEYFQ
jgi:hypothetical protein